jgi:hypothetical protein
MDNKKEKNIPSQAVGYYTHRPFLQRELDKLGPDSLVIELGVGDGSSLLLHEFAKKNPNCKVMGFETNPDWHESQKQKYQLDNYIFYLLSDYSELGNILTDGTDVYDLVFVDNAPWISRIQCIGTLESQTSVFVVHDYDYFNSGCLETGFEGCFWKSGYSDNFTIDGNFDNLPPTLVMTKRDQKETDE